MDAKIIIDRKIVALKFKDFEKYHSTFLKHDNLTAEERYLQAGGKLPDEKPKKGK
jgi:uncharacterized CHY-type Zn-finger protein